MNESLIEKIRENIKEKELDAIVITELYKILFLLGIESSFNIFELCLCLIITKEEILLIGDPFSLSLIKIPPIIKIREINVKNIEIISFLNDLEELLLEKKLNKIGSFEEIRLPKYKVKKLPDIFDEKFIIPDERRISILKENALICKKVLQDSLKELKTGISEISLRNIIDEKIYQFGGERRAFPTKVIFGENTSNPFGLSNGKKLKEGDLIFINFGIIRSGVGIELARTYLWGGENKFLKKVYNEITEIYEKFLSFISYGKISREIYNYAWKLVKEKNYEKNFFPPLNAPLTLIGKRLKISNTSNFLIKEGTLLYPQMSFYFPGKFGIKFQDVLLLESGKHVLLTNFLNKGDEVCFSFGQ
ncbi:MAG: M24 family metallopeptidase [candidate division WOR-3 bacterium]